MSNYVIMTDASSDLDEKVCEELDIQVIPMDFTLGNSTYTHYADQREISISDFYSKLKSGEDAVTSQISPGRYSDCFREQLEKGNDVIYMSLSSGLSGTFSSSVLVRNELLEEYPDRKIECIDSLCAAVGLGLLAVLCGKKKQEGASFEEMVNYIEDTKVKICHWFTVEDLMQLKRGGRIGAVSAVVGSALKIHPVLSLDQEGKLKVITKLRGEKKCMEYLLSRFSEDRFHDTETAIMIGHSENPEAAEELKKMILEVNPVKDVYIMSIGPVIGSHTGLGMLAVTFIGNNYNF